MKKIHFLRAYMPSPRVMGIFCMALAMLVVSILGYSRYHHISQAPSRDGLMSSDQIKIPTFSGYITNLAPYLRGCQVEAPIGDEVAFRSHLSSIFSTEYYHSIASRGVKNCRLTLQETHRYSYRGYEWRSLSGSLIWTMSGEEAPMVWSQDISLGKGVAVISAYTGTIELGHMSRDRGVPSNIAARIIESLPRYQRDGRIMSVGSGVLAIRPHDFPTPWRGLDQEIIYLRSDLSGGWVVDAYGFPELSRGADRPIAYMTGSAIALTFDDGPHPKYTPQVLDILAHYHQRATFCVLGSQAQRYPDLIKRIVAEGHELCNHSFDHQDFSQLSLSGVYDEIVRTDEVVDQILSGSSDGQNMRFVRPPYGALTRDIEYSIPREFLLWNQDSLDWKTKKSAKILSRLAIPKKGNIILFHDIHPQGIDALERYIQSYQIQGFSSITLSEMTPFVADGMKSGQSILSMDHIRFLKSPLLPTVRVFGE